MRRGLFLPIVATLGFVFLYAPIISLIVFSFNDSRLVTVWGGFSTKWYGELFTNPQVLDAGLLSLRVAGSSASIALVLGTLLMAVVASRDLQADGLAGIQTADLSELRFDVGQSGCPVSTYGAGTACPRAIRAPVCFPAALYCCSAASIPGLASCFPQADSSGATSSANGVGWAMSAGTFGISENFG